eukprot:scaffold844_cov602-Prasinococcus_capsulatus_cf.AAC.3
MAHRVGVVPDAWRPSRLVNVICCLWPRLQRLCAEFAHPAQAQAVNPFRGSGAQRAQRTPKRAPRWQQRERWTALLRLGMAGRISGWHLWR